MKFSEFTMEEINKYSPTVLSAEWNSSDTIWNMVEEKFPRQKFEIGGVGDPLKGEPYTIYIDKYWRPIKYAQLQFQFEGCFKVDWNTGDIVWGYKWDDYNKKITWSEPYNIGDYGTLGNTVRAVLDEIYDEFTINKEIHADDPYGFELFKKQESVTSGEFQSMAPGKKKKKIIVQKGNYKKQLEEIRHRFVSR